MRNTIKRYVLTLLLLVAIIGVAKFALSLCDLSEGWILYGFMSIIAILYAIAPLIAVMMTSGESLKVLIVKYNLSLRHVNFRMMLAYILLTMVLLPLLSIGIVFVLGNLLEMTDARVNSFAIQMTTYSIPMYLFGLLYYTIAAIGGEFAWRGFLEDKIRCKASHKYVFIGSVWWLVSIIYLLSFSRVDIIWLDFLAQSIVRLILYIVMSFYLAEAVRSSKTIWTSSVIIGLWTCSTSLYGFGHNASWLIVGGTSIVTIMAFVILFFVLRFVNKKVNKADEITHIN